jgi:lipopolysaccharide transport system ATP-binding protein
MGLPMSSKSPVLSVAHVGKSYLLHETPGRRLLNLASGGRWAKVQAFQALSDVSFEVSARESVGIIGVNGSGKSTLLQLIAGTLTPTTGAVGLRGRVAALLELGAGFNPELTGRENLSLGAHLHGLQADQIQSRLPAMIAFADIGDFIDQPVKFYSSGMFVRVAFALIAHVDADVMIVDEALAVGDAVFSQKCMRFLNAFMQKGTLIFVSHDMASIRALCNRVIWLEHGKVRAEGDPKKVGDAYLESCYGRHQSVQLQETSQEPMHEAVVVQAERVHPKDAVAEDFRLNVAINPLVIQSVPEFDVSGFGAGQARITQVTLHNAGGVEIRQTEGGKRVRLRIEASLQAGLTDLVFGYFIRNRMGLNIFGDNTYLTYASQPVSGQAGAQVYAEFEFIMPFMPKGDYSVCVALATGSNLEHVQQHWINEALIIQSLDNFVHADVMALPSISMQIGRM